MKPAGARCDAFVKWLARYLIAAAGVAIGAQYWCSGSASTCWHHTRAVISATKSLQLAGMFFHSVLPCGRRLPPARGP